MGFPEDEGAVGYSGWVRLRDPNLYDVFRLVTCGCMVIDHVGWLFFSRHVWLRAVGRFAMPVFLYVVMRSRTPRGVELDLSRRGRSGAAFVGCGGRLSLVEHPLDDFGLPVGLSKGRVGLGGPEVERLGLCWPLCAGGVGRCENCRGLGTAVASSSLVTRSVFGISTSGKPFRGVSFLG
jgi:hypothetical protein